MADLRQMGTDMQAALDAHAKQSRENLERVADTMVDKLQAMSNPAYGVLVRPRKVRVPDGFSISVEVESSKGPVGTLWGGQRAIHQAVQDSMDRTAREAGL